MPSLLDLLPGNARNRLFATPTAGNRSERRRRPAAAAPTTEPFLQRIHRCPEPNAARRQPHLDRSGCNKEYAISAISPTDDALVRHSETRSQQFGNALELFLVEAREHVQLLDQAIRIQPDVEVWAWLGCAGP